MPGTLTLPEEIREHLADTPTAETIEETAEEWWIRATELHQQALDEGYVMEGDSDEW